MKTRMLQRFTGSLQKALKSGSFFGGARMLPPSRRKHAIHWNPPVRVPIFTL